MTTRSFLHAAALLLVFGIGGCSDRAADSGGSNGKTVAGVADARAITGYSAEQVAAGTWVIHGPRELPSPGNKGFMNNPGFVTTPGGVVVIDPGSSVYTGEMVLREIAAVTNAPVIAVINTHVHGDHWLGNDAISRAYPDVAIYGHTKMIERVDAGAGLEWLDLMSQLTEGATDGTEIVKPGRSSDGDETLKLGGHDFEIIHLGKAHTDTDIMILYRQGQVLFTGDNAGNERILRIQFGSFSGNIETLQAAVGMAPEVVVPGHGMTGGVEVLEAYRDYLSTLYEKVQEGYEEDLSDFEMKPDVHDALTAYHDWSGYEEEVGKHISQAYLEIEAADF